jgi:hypothetical protein
VGEKPYTSGKNAHKGNTTFEKARGTCIEFEARITVNSTRFIFIVG